MRFSLHRNSFCCICWFTVLLILIWQVLLSSFSIFSNIALMLLYFSNIVSFKGEKRKTILLIIWGILLLVGYSIIQENEIALIIRFSIILFFVLGAYLIKLNYKICLKSLFLISFLLCVVLIIFEMLLLFVYGVEDASRIRFFFIDNSLGDVYFKSGYYKIQVRGNAIIPFVYMLSYIVDVFPVKHKRIFQIIYLLAIGIAGNFAFFLAIIGFHTVFYFSNVKEQRELFRRLTIGFIVLLTAGGIFFSYVSDVLEEKKGYSNAIRIEQATLLLEDIQESSITTLFGKGLGNTINVVTHFRDYTGDTYYELQVLYIFNQLGVIPFAFFVLVNLLFIYKYISDFRLKVVYGGYVLYAVTNPYILDTNHVVVIISLLAVQNQLSNNLSPIWEK